MPLAGSARLADAMGKAGCVMARPTTLVRIGADTLADLDALGEWLAERLSKGEIEPWWDDDKGGRPSARSMPPEQVIRFLLWRLYNDRRRGRESSYRRRGQRAKKRPAKMPLPGPEQGQQ